MCRSGLLARAGFLEQRHYDGGGGFVLQRIFSSTDVNRIEAVVFVPNAASCRVLEKCGFRKEGVLRQSVFKNGQFYDAAVYGLLASERGEV